MKIIEKNIFEILLFYSSTYFMKYTLYFGKPLYLQNKFFFFLFYT